MRDRRPRNTIKPTSKEKHQINEAITAANLRLIGVDGGQLGIVAREEALRLADENNVDLVEVAPNADPPVCKLLDYGKLKYKEQKRAAEARKKGATQTIKEIRVRYSTDKHDLETKVRNARRFLDGGDRVKFLMRFRGREVVYRELGVEIFSKIAEELHDISIIEENTPLLGQRMTMVLAPRVAKEKTE